LSFSHTRFDHHVANQQASNADQSMSAVRGDSPTGYGVSLVATIQLVEFDTSSTPWRCCAAWTFQPLVHQRLPNAPGSSLRGLMCFQRGA
jgi:hypothetical protein